MNDPSTQMPQPEPVSRLEARRQRRAARRASIGGSGRSGAWIVGLLLIVLGAAYLLQDLGNFSIPLNNWWTLFILIPAIGAFSRAWRAYQDAGNQLTAQAGGALILGALLTLVTAAFLFNFNWTIWGPVLIILVGIGLLANTLLGRGD
jgi:hypothetical protein